MLISQGFKSETGDLETFVKHCERSETMYNITVTQFSASDKDSDTKRHKRRSKFKEREENSKKHRKKNSSLYYSIYSENKNHTSSECNVLDKKAKEKDNPKYGKMITKTGSKNLTSCREKLHTKGPLISSIKS